VIEKELPQEVSPLAQKQTNTPTRAFVSLADKYLKNNRIDEAIRILTEGLQHHPTYVAARMMLGNAYQRGGYTIAAKKEFEEIAKLHPENVLAYKKLALIHKEAGQLGEAVELCNCVLTIDPDDKQAKRLLAAVQEEISDIEDRDADTLPKISFDMLSPSHTQEVAFEDSPIPDIDGFDWPQRAETIPLQEATLETEPIDESLDEISIIDDALKSESDWLPIEENEPVPAPLAFASKTEYNRPSLYQIRLEEWLVAIAEKGVRR